MEKVESQIPNSFRKSRPHTASQAKPPNRKLSHTNYLFMRFSIKRVTKSRKSVIFLSVFNFFEKVGSFFLKNLFFILSRLRPVSSWVMCLASRFLENHKWLLENTNQSPAGVSPARESLPERACQREPARESLPEEVASSEVP